MKSTHVFKFCHLRNYKFAKKIFILIILTLIISLIFGFFMFIGGSKIDDPDWRTRKPAFHVVYSNLANKTDRRKHMEKLLDFLKLAHNRFEAVDGEKFFSTLSYRQSFKNLRDINLGIVEQIMMISPEIGFSAIGCFLTYLSLMREISNYNTSEPIVSLEDDVDLEIDFKTRVLDGIRSAPADWDVILCDYCDLKNSSGWENLGMTKVKHFACTDCFIVRNSSTARRIAERLNVKLIDKPVDFFLGSLAEKGELQIYALDEKIATQRRDLFNSSIPTSGKLGTEWLENSALDYMNQQQVKTYVHANNNPKMFVNLKLS